MSEKTAPLDFSVPANNQKIIEIYNKMRIGQICVNGDYQRKLVWKKAHKINFIDTILKNYPFPEVYFAPGSLDPVELLLVDEIVDGQQRLSTIKDYIEGTDIFSLDGGKLPIKKFSDLSVEEKQKFLNYEVSVRYLKNATIDQVKEIFARINKTEYSLNSMERLNAQWGDSEFVCFAKQIVEMEYEPVDLQYALSKEDRDYFLKFFHGNDDGGVFTENDVSRMLALQYIMVLVATLDLGEYFSRNEKIESLIKSNNELFLGADVVQKLLRFSIDKIASMGLRRSSIWLSKANLFTLIVEISKWFGNDFDVSRFSERLIDLERRYVVSEFASSEPLLNSEEERYFNFAREAVNEKQAREYRGDFIARLISEST